MCIGFMNYFCLVLLCVLFNYKFVIINIIKLILHMNKERRKRILAVLQELESIKVEIESIIDEEQCAFDNLPESIQESDRGMIMENSIESLESANESIEAAVDSLEEIE